MGDILRSGIQPRDCSGCKGQWEDYPSRPDLVYLTAAYPLYFALNAGAGVGDDNVAIIEVAADELPVSLLLPDEDFIAQGLAQQSGVALSSVHDEVRESLEGYAHHALDSVRYLGNVAFKGVVPVSAITRYCVLDPAKQQRLAWAGIDPVISPLNYHFCGAKYRSMVAYLFGDRPDWLMGFGDNEAWAMTQEQMKPGSYREIMDGFANREGITVTTVRSDDGK